ncbi:MAG: TonB-dependent receptor [Thermodesulfobacteriota bacterium]
MSIYRLTTIFAFIVLIFSPGVYKEVWGDETDDVKKQMQELRQQMESIQKKLEELEEKNKKLEEEAQKQKEEKEIEKAITEAAPPPKEGGFQRIIQSLNPDISVIGTFAAAYFSTDDPILHAENDPENTGINLQEIEIGFQGVVDPYFRWDSFFSIQREGLETEEAYTTTLFTLPLNTQIRAGLMRSKFGRINLQHREVQDFVTLPLPVTSFLAEHLNPVGVEFNFLLPLPWFSELSASVNSSNGLETPTFQPSPDANNLGLLLYIAHLSNFLELSDDLSLSLGGSFATGSNGTSSTNRSNLYGADLFVKYNPLKYSSSYQQVWLQSEFMYRQAETPEPEGNFSDWGAYAQAVYRFAKRWNTGARFDFVNTNNNSFVPPPGEEGLFPARKELNYAAMLTFNPSEFSRIRLQYEFDDPDFRGSYSAFYIQFQYSLGPHGAHPF